MDVDMMPFSKQASETCEPLISGASKEVLIRLASDNLR